MKLVLCLLALCGLSAAHMNAKKMVKEINSMHTTWKAGINHGVESMGDFRNKLRSSKKPIRNRLPVFQHDESKYEIPEHFDSREVWPECPTIRQIRTQANIGACWAVASVEVMSDRICIASKGKTSVEISAVDLISCYIDGLHPVGDEPDPVWTNWIVQGLVTGGSYESQSGCRPYPFVPCGPSPLPPCPEEDDPVPPCVRECQKNYTKTYNEDKYYGKSAYEVRNVTQAQIEIMMHGPIAAGIQVYDDLTYYKSGVYQHVEGGEIGGHEVKIIGWGVEDGLPYWLVANSWSVYWGDKGFFKILRGDDELWMLYEFDSGLPKL